MVRRVASVALLVGSLAALSAHAEDRAGDAVPLPPWIEADVPNWARSVHIIHGDQPLKAAPSEKAERRGSAMRESRLPLYGARTGPGCNSMWLHVGPRAWTCGDEVLLSGAPAIAPGNAGDLTATADGLPYQYYFAGQDGSLAYDNIDDTDVGEPRMTLEPGFAVAIVEERFLGRERYGRTNRGLWVPMRDLGAARSFLFSGESITTLIDGQIPVAWVLAERAAVYRKSGASFAPTGKSKKRFDRVGWLESSTTFGESYARIDDDNTWIRARDVRHPTIAPPPDERDIKNGARWIDVDLATQTLVAYAGTTPVYATIVSTGKGKTKGHPFETPTGVHRIWVKLVSNTMDNLEDEGAYSYWRIEDVPYVQFFHKGVALHGAFWHRQFGNVRSHGCVNLAPIDAQRLFSFTGPIVGAGWTAALPTDHDHGTVVRVR